MVHSINGVQLYPSNNLYNAPITYAPLHPNSAAYVAAVGPTQAIALHFSTIASPPAGFAWGIPYNIATNSTPTYHMTSFGFPTVSADLAYPIPNSPQYEEPSNGSADHLLLSLNADTGILYELTGVVYNSGANTWSAASGGSFNLSANTLPTFSSGISTSSGMPVLPGLVTYDEVASGAITHALCCAMPFGAGINQQIWPAIHNDGSTTGYPPQGIRFRLKANFDISGFSATNQVILQAMKTYGIYNQDSGANAVVIRGAPDNRWNNTDLALVGAITMNNFEFIDETAMIVNASNSMAVYTLRAKVFPSAARRGAITSTYSGIVLADGPGSYYRLGESSGITVVHDATSGHHDGTLIAGVTPGQAGGLLYDSDTAMSFDGSTGYIALPGAINLSAITSFSVEALIKPTALSVANTILSTETTSTTNKGFDFALISGAAKVHLQIGNGTTNATAFTGTLANANTYYHIV